MTIDLEAIESRINDGINDLDGPGYSGIADDAFSALAEIIAEVERLRGEVAEWARLLIEVKKEGARSAVEARAAERAAVVAWLRSRGMADYAQSHFDYAAAMIERGGHRREEEK